MIGFREPMVRGRISALHLLPHRVATALFLGAMVIGACTDRAAGPTLPRPSTAASAQQAKGGDGSGVLYWNTTARDLVSRVRENPPRASRGYALLSVAQLEALLALRHGGIRRLSGPIAQSIVVRHALDQAAVDGASAVVLGALFPAAADELEEKAQRRLAAIVDATDDAAEPTRRAHLLGREIGTRVIAFGATDGADRVWQGDVPVGVGYWWSSAVPPVPPLLPGWGAVRPWLLRSGSELRPEPPPEFGSPAFAAALAVVRRISDTRTDEQLRIARFWADGPGTATPPGHWNQIAADVIERHHTTELRTAWIFAMMNTALMDAGIACWDAKYTYWLLRPSQADPAITTPVGLPNFPSYISGHSTFSGAAAEILAHVFPDERRMLRAMAEEAADSRLYGGIHYRFDNEVGLRVGQAIARIAIKWWSVKEPERE